MLVIANELSHFGNKAIEDVAPALVHEAGSSQKSEPQKKKNKKSM